MSIYSGDPQCCVPATEAGAGVDRLGAVEPAPADGVDLGQYLASEARLHPSPSALSELVPQPPALRSSRGSHISPLRASYGATIATALFWELVVVLAAAGEPSAPDLSARDAQGFPKHGRGLYCLPFSRTPNHDSDWGLSGGVLERLARRIYEASPKPADAAADLLAFSTLPAEHRFAIRSNNSMSTQPEDRRRTQCSGFLSTTPPLPSLPSLSHRCRGGK